MEVDFALLADRADIVNGKLYLLGGAFDSLYAVKVPVKHQAMTLAMRFLFSPAECDQMYKLEVRLIDADGKKVLAVPGQFSLKRSPKSEKGYRTAFLTAINFFNTQLRTFGDYSFEIFVNGHGVKSVPLRLIQMEPPKEEPPKPKEEEKSPPPPPAAA